MNSKEHLPPIILAKTVDGHHHAFNIFFFVFYRKDAGPALGKHGGSVDVLMILLWSALRAQEVFS